MNKRQFDQKHLTLVQREFIETSLNNNCRIIEISMSLSKDPTSISKEIKRNRMYKEPSKYGGYSNICINRFNCDQTSVCNNKKCFKTCSRCDLCNKSCSLFIPELCSKLSRAPHVCNGCERKSSCRLEKFYYRAKEAHAEYETLKSTSREGFNLTKEELDSLNSLVAPLIDKGQPVNHIYANHKKEIPCAISTFYSYVDKGALSIKNIDLRRKVKYKKRKRKKNTTIRKNSKVLIGRKYSDFTNYISVNPYVRVVEMDLVEGVKGGKVFLTLFFRATNLMLIFLLNP